MSDDRSAALQRAVGDVYEVRRLIGRGGFAEVYEAYEPRLKRSVAIKVLGADLSANPEMLDRFRREAEAVARLRHPHIVPIYNVGDATGIAWYAMPMVEGESLRAWLERERPLPTADAWRVLREVTAALAAAHRAGFVHRDVKPENIMLDGHDRRALVMDFGIARAVAAEKGEKLTATGIAIGTPRYMSPEQAAGETVDARSDVYSVGVVGYEMLSGRLPFEGSARDVMVKQATEKPPPLAELAPTAPGTLVETIERAINRDPAKRFANATELAAALEPSAAAGPALSSAALNVAERAPLSVRRLLGGVGVAGLVIAALLHSRAEPWTRVEVITRAGTRVQGITRAQAAQVAGEFLYARGARGSYSEYIAFAVRDTAVGYLNAALGKAQGSAWAAKHYTAHEWRVRRYYTDSSTWTVAVDMAGKVRAVNHWRPDAPVAPVNADTALRVAAAWLTQLGWAESELTAANTGTDIAEKHRFRWRTSRDSVGGSNAQAVHQEVSVATHGTRVVDYDHRLTIPAPDAFKASVDERDQRTFWVVLLMFVPAIMVILSTIRLRRRVGEESAREKLARNLCLGGGAIAYVGQMAAFTASRALGEPSLTPSSWFWFVLTLAGFLLMAILAEWMVFALDQNARQHYPGLVAGYLEVGAGRLTGRPMAVGWLAAYGVGGMLAAGNALANLMVVNSPTRPDISFDLARAFNQAVPLGALTDLVLAFAIPATMLMVLLAITRLSRREVAPVLAVLMFTVTDVVSTESHRGVVFLMYLTLYTVGAIVLLRFGLLVMSWGVYIMAVLGSGMTLLAASSAGFRVAGIVTLAFVALPAVLGVIAERRLQGSLGGGLGTRTPSAA